jgi:sec-independent protein translocase protein TatA
LAVVLIIALVIFGPKRLPELGKSMGKGIREFRGSISGRDDDEEKAAEIKRELESASPATTVTAAEPVEGEIVSEPRT